MRSRPQILARGAWTQPTAAFPSPFRDAWAVVPRRAGSHLLNGLVAAFQLRTVSLEVRTFSL
jgi:hypothetical protein